LHGRPRSTCQLVGECDIGCNFGSKNSLDYTYLSDAMVAGAEIRTLCEVATFRPAQDGFVVQYREHELGVSSKQSPTREISCKRLILSAGTLGTTYLLLRNARHFPALSPRLGERFSGNGDFLGLVLRAKQSKGDGGGPRLLYPSSGPVITGAARLPDRADGGGATGRGGYIQDAGYPQLVNWAVEQGLPGQSVRIMTFLVRRGVGRVFGRPKPTVGSSLRRLLGPNITTATSMPLLGMGRDAPDGTFKLQGSDLDLEWHPRASRPWFDNVNAKMREMADALGGRYGTSLLWKLNLLVTVHPLGGCPMGNSSDHGVVNSFGEVFGAPGLSIADGSVMPGPVGANPSMTIAALADRFASHMLDQW
jgi:cholesterol oxidase